MSNRLWRLCFCLLVMFFISACETVPQAQVDEAHALGDGVWRFEVTHSNNSALSVSRGVGDNIDLGVQLDIDHSLTLDADRGLLPDPEQKDTYTAYAKYSHVNRLKGFSFASLVGGFRGEDDHVNGYFLGPVTSYRNGLVLFSLRARYNKLTSRNINKGEEARRLNFPADEVGQLDASFRLYLLQDTLSLKLGYGCVHPLGNREGIERSFGLSRGKYCTTTLGATIFYR